MKKIDIRDRVLNIIIILVLILIVFLSGYIYISIKTINADKYETKLIDSYNYINDFSQIIKNSNKNMMEQFSEGNKNNSTVSQLTVQSLMYNVAKQDNKKINSMFKRYDNGYVDWEHADKIFKNTKIYYPNDKQFTLLYANNLVNRTIGKNVDLFSSKHTNMIQNASALGIYYQNLEFDEKVNDSLMDCMEITGPHYVTSTNTFDLIKLPLKGNKTAIFVSAKEDNTTDLKSHLSELNDLVSLQWYTKDIAVDISPFSSITSGVPGSILTDIKNNTITWDNRFNDIVVVNYVECNNATSTDTKDTTNSVTTEITESTEDIENGEYAPEDTYAETYVMNNNFILLIQDNNTKLIECICDMEQN